MFEVLNTVIFDAARGGTEISLVARVIKTTSCCAAASCGNVAGVVPESGSADGVYYGSLIGS